MKKINGKKRENTKVKIKTKNFKKIKYEPN